MPIPMRYVWQGVYPLPRQKVTLPIVIEWIQKRFLPCFHFGDKKY